MCQCSEAIQCVHFLQIADKPQKLQNCYPTKSLLTAISLLSYQYSYLESLDTSKKYTNDGMLLRA